MTNSDYLLKATIKKVTEKLNEVLAEKIEEATNIAQDAPEKIKKEFEDLKKSIIEEATRMENELNMNENSEKNKHQDLIVNKTLEEIKNINEKIEQLNKEINN